ncbi:MAG: ECF-type sigma factor [Planctomycetota bacterium]
MITFEDSESEPRLQRAVYDELHRMASRLLAAERAAHSLQTTMIVHDAYLLLLKQENVDSSDRCQVLAVGSRIIRRMLVDHARRRTAIKRGGKQGRGVSLDQELPDARQAFDTFDVADALDALAEQNPRAARVVELRFFGGLDNSEIAELFNVSRRTVSTDWRFAKAWLSRRLDPDAPV